MEHEVEKNNQDQENQPKQNNNQSHDKRDQVHNNNLQTVQFFLFFAGAPFPPDFEAQDILPELRRDHIMRRPNARSVLVAKHFEKSQHKGRTKQKHKSDDE
jgi:hypothetical protein